MPRPVSPASMAASRAHTEHGTSGARRPHAAACVACHVVSAGVAGPRDSFDDSGAAKYTCRSRSPPVATPLRRADRRAVGSLGVMQLNTMTTSREARDALNGVGPIEIKRHPRDGMYHNLAPPTEPHRRQRVLLRWSEGRASPSMPFERSDKLVSQGGPTLPSAGDHNAKAFLVHPFPTSPKKPSKEDGA